MSMKTTLAERIKQARKAAGISQKELGEAAGISQAAIQKLETGAAQTTTKVVEIARVLNISPEWLASGSGNASQLNTIDTTAFVARSTQNQESAFKVEVLDIQASAGEGVMIVDDYIETITAIEYTPEEARRLFDNRPAHTIKMITVKGDSMAGTFEPRDQIFVDISIEGFDGDGIYVFVLDNQLYIKRLQKQHRRIAIISDNAKYETWYLEEKDMNGFLIQAKVLVSQSIQYRFHA